MGAPELWPQSCDGPRAVYSAFNVQLLISLIDLCFSFSFIQNVSEISETSEQQDPAPPEPSGFLCRYDAHRLTNRKASHESLFQHVLLWS